MTTKYGSAVIIQTQRAYQIANKLAFCEKCWSSPKEPPTLLRRCTGCHCVSYCSKEDQMAHWQQHKRFCRFVQSKGAANSFLSATAVEKDEGYMMDMIIDSYRIRVEHDHLYRNEDHGVYYHGKQLPDGNVFASGDAEADFQNYLDYAELSKLLPKWFEFYKRMECLARAVDRQGNAQNIFTQIEEDQLLERYGGDRQIRSQLILLAEAVVGYEGKGPPKDSAWIESFRSYVSIPEVREIIEMDNISSLNTMYAKHKKDSSASTIV